MILSPILMLLLATPLGAAPTWRESLPEALTEAKKAKTRVLADFTAPWCYSCYFMEKHVLAGPAFEEAARGLVLARIDVDQPEGRAFKAKRRVSFIPSFLLLDGTGQELGRIVGEHREDDFVRQLKQLVAPASAAEDQAVRTLESLIQKDRGPEAASFAAKPSPASLEALRARLDWQILEARIELRRGPTPRSLDRMIRLNDGCDLAYDLMTALKSELPAATFQGLQERLEAWAKTRLWVSRFERCADFRSGVQVLADLYERLGKPEARQNVLDRAATLLSEESEKAGLGNDRNLEDDRRYFLELAKRSVELAALYPRLIEAYPADYVYSYRFAKWLNSEGRPVDALPWAEKAGQLCYGANRVSVTKVHAEILRALGQGSQAVPMLKREIRAYRKLLPHETKSLKELLKSLR